MLSLAPRCGGGRKRRLSPLSPVIARSAADNGPCPVRPPISCLCDPRGGHPSLSLRPAAPRGAQHSCQPAAAPLCPPNLVGCCAPPPGPGPPTLHSASPPPPPAGPQRRRSALFRRRLVPGTDLPVDRRARKGCRAVGASAPPASRLAGRQVSFVAREASEEGSNGQFKCSFFVWFAPAVFGFVPIVHST